MNHSKIASIHFQPAKENILQNGRNIHLLTVFEWLVPWGQFKVFFSCETTRNLMFQWTMARRATSRAPNIFSNESPLEVAGKMMFLFLPQLGYVISQEG